MTRCVHVSCCEFAFLGLALDRSHGVSRALVVVRIQGAKLRFNVLEYMEDS
jgi:hypothetical protein